MTKPYLFVLNCCLKNNFRQNALFLSIRYFTCKGLCHWSITVMTGSCVSCTVWPRRICAGTTRSWLVIFCLNAEHNLRLQFQYLRKKALPTGWGFSVMKQLFCSASNEKIVSGQALFVWRKVKTTYKLGVRGRERLPNRYDVRIKMRVPSPDGPTRN